MMADGKVVIDLEINDKNVDKKLNTADKKVDKFAKDVSQSLMKHQTRLKVFQKKLLTMQKLKVVQKWTLPILKRVPRQ